jgi:sulfite exporter TauE/SafE
MHGFLLGLTNGTTCLAFCAPVLVPFLLGEGRSIRQSLVTLLEFLGGRMAGYALFGVLAWATGSLLTQATPHEGLVIGLVYVGLAALLGTSALGKDGPSGRDCAVAGAQARLRRWPALLPAGMGFLAGLKLCPPLLLAFANAARTGTLAGSLAFFLAFFLGTSIYFIPLSSLGALTHVSAMRMIGRLTAVIVALYYLWVGMLLVVGGVS